ncbi:IPT/TIG domain-containing protein [Maribellus sp. YY47]|uniref:IPT/TIG domain-containing protein n=1 Tax=Maribellus sp. YY47 TaxID=2929486 RepID=UPI002001D7F1|nr:IPT/TIG domain-containing protein [Maribellus sp. YY47]MCK3684387.1 IPT/TIG domain-containing protein [Maribellus sp. YY47]
MKRPLLVSTIRGLFVPVCVSLIFLFSCNDKDDGIEGGKPYDPTKPVVLNTFYPDSGKYQEKVILTGENFGTDPESIRVYFNNKQAAVIGATGTDVYVQAPRLPGDTCTISIAVGNDSLSYDHKFIYETSVTVTTIAGNGNGYDYEDGDLSTAILKPRYLCTDNEDNIFVIVWNEDRSTYAIARIDEEANELVTIAKGVVANVPCVAPETGIITFATETTIGSFYTLDPKEFWAPRFREMKFADKNNMPENGWKHSMVVNPEDGYIYTRYYYGEIVRINPKTYDAEVIYKTDIGDSYGLTFNPTKPNILYMSFWSNALGNANSICSIDVTDPENSFTKLSGSTSGGHRDGPIAVSQFKDPAQIFCDADGNMYVADCSNHVIRRITPDDLVETVLGMPGVSGWKDGTKEDALFNGPRGIGISKDGSVYVADYGNSRVRKLSIN